MAPRHRLSTFSTFFVFFTLIFHVPSLTFAQKLKRKTQKQPDITELAPTSAAPSVYQQDAPAQLQWSATGSLGMNDGNFGFGAGFRGELPVKFKRLTLRIGGETGIYRFAPAGASVWIVPFAVTSAYDLQFTDTNAILPYIRVALGLDVTMFHAGNASDTSAKLHLVFHPGFDIPNTRYFGELAIGAMGGGFLLLPTFGARF